MGKTSIEYLDYTWNPLAMRCTKVSEACDNCWHLERCKRLQVNPVIPVEQRYAYAGDFPPMITGRLDEPLHLKKPRRIGVQFMGDLFHLDVPFEYVDKIFAVAASCPRHTFLILTKRPARMAEWFKERPKSQLPENHWREWPLSNVWIGVTIEHPKYGYRMDQLSDIPAAVRFISFEPLLADFSEYPGFLDGCDWAIAGGESGANARPMHPDWVRSIRDLCQASGVPFFFKGWGDWAAQIGENFYVKEKGDVLVCRVGIKAAGRLLDGREWNEFPKGGKGA